MALRKYIVTFHELAVVTELVDAHTAAEAMERVRQGEGNRISFEIDETRWPTSWRAVRQSHDSGRDA